MFTVTQRLVIFYMSLDHALLLRSILAKVAHMIEKHTARIQHYKFIMVLAEPSTSIPLHDSYVPVPVLVTFPLAMQDHTTYTSSSPRPFT